MARLRTAPALQKPPATAPQPTTRQVLKEKTNTAQTKATVYENDGNTEDLVKDARTRRGRPRKAPPTEEELVMAGGLGLAGSDGMNSDHSAAPSTTKEPAKSDAVSASASRTNRRPARTTRKVVQTEEQREITEGVKRRMQAASRKENVAPQQESSDKAPSSASRPKKPTARKSGASVMERSEFSITPSPPPQSRLSTGPKQRQSLTQPGSAIRSHGTPAVESSILALKNFKRRPRQPSMLQMVQQRTASARPSAVHNAASEVSAVEVSDAGDEVEDFEPEAEGTPLNVAKKGRSVNSSSKAAKTRLASSPAKTDSAGRKRKSEDAEQSSTSALDALRSKRRKSQNVDLPEDPLVSFEESASISPGSPRSQRESSVRVTAEVQVVDSQSSPTGSAKSSCKRRSYVQDEDVAIASTEQAKIIDLVNAPDDVEADFDVNGTMADPLSSSPPPPVSPVATQRTDIMADPRTQITPPRPKRDQSTKQKKKPTEITTADLQSLLPKRRQPLKPRKRKSEYDFDLLSDEDEDEDVPLDSNELEENEDELGGKLRRQTKSSTKTKSKQKPSASSNSTARQTKPSHTRKSSTTLSRKSTTAAKYIKTYGRNPTSDKENTAADNNNNEDDFSLSDNDSSALPDTSLSMYEAAQSKELAAAKRKFERVDEWDMEFESMSFEEHRSSSQGWR